MGGRGSTCIRKAKASCEASSGISLGFHWPPLPARGARKVCVLDGYLPTLNKGGLSESEEGQQDDTESPSSKGCHTAEERFPELVQSSVTAFFSSVSAR